MSLFMFNAAHKHILGLDLADAAFEAGLLEFGGFWICHDVVLMKKIFSKMHIADQVCGFSNSARLHL